MEFDLTRLVGPLFFGLIAGTFIIYFTPKLEPEKPKSKKGKANSDTKQIKSEEKP